MKEMRQHLPVQPYAKLDQDSYSSIFKEWIRVEFWRETDNKEGGSAALRTDQQQTVFRY